MSKFKSIAAAVAVSLAALGGMAATSTTVDAKVIVIKGGHHHHHRHFRHRYIAPLVTTGPGCGLYWHRWEVTGNPYWKRRYYRCIY